jgi:predicted DNA-binding protein
MSMLDRRLQVLIDEDRWERLERISKRRKVTVSTLVREAIDASLGNDIDQRRDALRSVLAAEPMHVPAPGDLRGELDEMRAGKLG